jgi:hypothetical protein
VTGASVARAMQAARYLVVASASSGLENRNPCAGAAAQCAQLLLLVVRFDAFCGYLEIQLAGKCDDGFNDLGIGQAGTRPADERFVDLKRIDRESMEIRE